jgi:hypothetical protein
MSKLLVDEISDADNTGPVTVTDGLTVQGAFTSLGIDDNATSTAITLNSSGYVGIGTASPATTLDVTKSAGGNWIASFQNTTAATSYGVNIAEPSGAAVGYPLFRVGESYAPYTDYLRVNTGGGVVAGGGIYIGGTAAANLLDDYEEGTWTPVLTNWTNVGTPTVTGNYTITGNLVYVEIKIIPATSVSATSGNATMTLPISPANSVVCVWANGSNGAGLGTALVSTTELWAPVISSTANTLVASATYRTA